MGKSIQYFKKGDVIRTTPEKGFWGIAVVLNAGQKKEIAPGKMSCPLCHILITPLLFQHEVTFSEINPADLSVLIFEEFAKRSDGARIPWRVKTCIDIYTNRNKANLAVIGNIDPSSLYSEQLIFHPLEDRFFLCGDVKSDLGREAYIDFMRKSENGEHCKIIR